MITPEERKRRAKERKEQVAQLMKRLPMVNFCHEDKHGTVQLYMAGGNDWELRVRKHGKWKGHGEWEEHSIVLADPQHLARLIRGLVARFNAMVCEINAEVDAFQIEQLRKIEERTPKPRRTD